MTDNELTEIESIQITQEQKSFITHALGATPRYHKKDWGFRNHFTTGEDCHDVEPLRDLVSKGLMVEFERFGDVVFSATRQGAIKVGFKQYQLQGKKFPLRTNND